jgi:hypothetical protein
MEGKYSDLFMSLCFLAWVNKYKSKYRRSDNKHPAEQDLYSQSGMCDTLCKIFLTEIF